MQENNNQEQQNINVTVKQESTSVTAILSIVFWIISIFILGLVFVPLSLIFWIIALFGNNKWLAIFWIILSLIWALTSPTIWALIAWIRVAIFGF